MYNMYDMYNMYNDKYVYTLHETNEIIATLVYKMCRILILLEQNRILFHYFMI